MKLHGNARTCPRSRRLLVERIESQNWSLTAAAEAAGVSVRCARTGDRSTHMRPVRTHAPARERSGSGGLVSGLLADDADWCAYRHVVGEPEDVVVVEADAAV